MPHRYRAEVRASRADVTATDDPFFRSWAEFGQWQARHHGQQRDDMPWLCDILAEATNKRSDLPLAWPTLVLGSECLRLLTPQTERAIELLPSALLAQLSEPVAVEGERRREKTLQFVKQLIADRLGLAMAKRDEVEEAADSEEPLDLDAEPFEPSETGGDELSAEQELDARQTAERASKKFEVWELRLLEAAAAVTECYFSAKAHYLHSVSRWSTDTLRLGRRTAELSRLAHASLIQLVNTLDESKGEQSRARQITLDLSGGLDRGSGEISLASLEALTEIAWQIVTRYFTIFSDYPEWPEFLVRLSLDDTRSRLIRQGPPRPALKSALDATALIRDALTQETIESASGYVEGQPDREAARVYAYRHFAEMLYKMAQFRAKTLPLRSRANKPRPQGPVAPRSRVLRTPPPASAFVTTFDLELEFALAHHHPDQPFVIAVPANVIDNAEGKKERLASTMWLGCVIKPDPEKDLYSRIVDPPADAWFTLGTLVTQDKGVDMPLTEGGNMTALEEAALQLVRNALPETVELLGELPLIVRLAGAPLITLPPLQRADQTLTALGSVVREAADLPLVSIAEDEPPTWSGSSEQVEIQLAHATLLDEHNALRLSLPEVLKEHPWGLPRDLTAPVNANGYWRYWMLLGVELSDPVIRYRVFSQILGAGLTTSQNPSQGENKKGYSRPNRAGVALNRKSMNARAIDLLLWCGFDIVRDSAAPAPISAELAHWLEHLTRLGDPNAIPLESWPWQGKECHLTQALPGKGESA